jgi:DNA-binding MarR family transcriptional regulator
LIDTTLAIYGYRLKEIADYLAIYYTTVSKALKNIEEKSNWDGLIIRRFQEASISRTVPLAPSITWFLF